MRVAILSRLQKTIGDETWSSEFAPSSFGIPIDCSLVLIGLFLTLIARRISIRTGLSHVNHSSSIQTNTNVLLYVVYCDSPFLSAFFYSCFALAFISHACVNVFHSLQVRRYLQLTKGEADLYARSRPRFLFAALSFICSSCRRSMIKMHSWKRHRAIYFIFGHVSFKSFCLCESSARFICARL